MVRPSLSWSDVVVAIPTMLERARLVAELGERVAVECQGAVLAKRLHVPGTAASIDFPALMAHALTASADRGSTWILQLEDDVWLAPDFGALAIDALVRADEAGADALTIFTRTKADLDLMPGPSLRRQSPASLSMTQGVFVRRSMMIGFDEWAPSWYREHPQHNHASDLLLGSWLSRRKAKLYAHIPSLVQHRAVPSMLPSRGGTRQSTSYRMAFGEVPS